MTALSASVPVSSLKHSQRARGRYEFKYLLKPEIARRAINFIKPYLKLDPYGADRPGNYYTVRSIYYDSPGFECFQAKIGGQKFREKYRLRTYDEPQSAPVHFELKQKNGLDYFKHKVPLNQDELKRLIAKEYAGLQHLAEQGRNKKTLDRFFYQIYRKAYAPALLATYDREAYVDPREPTIRVTLDMNLRAKMFPLPDEFYEERGLAYPIGDWVIFEVKFTRLVPRWMHALNGRFQLKHQACSKYCTGVAHFFGEKPNARKGFRYF